MRKSQILLSVALIAGCSKEPVAQIHEITAAPYATGQFVAFDTEGSIDDHKEPLPLTFHWRIVDAPVGSAAEVFGADMSTFSFKPDQYGDYTVGLVADNGKVSSAEVLATVTVDACGNEAPVVDSITGTPSAPGAGQDVGLIAATSDADSACGQDANLTYAWALTSVPTGSAALLSDVAAAEPWFVADVPGDYSVALVVTDVTGRSSTVATSTFTASDCGSASPSASVEVTAPWPTGPSADVSATAIVNDIVALDASGSTDADLESPCSQDGALHYQWSVLERPAGSTRGFNDASIAAPSFVPDLPGTYKLMVNVSDDAGHTSQGTVDLDVSPIPPIGTLDGFDVQFVAGGTSLWNRPKGIALDNGDIYVAQSNASTITKTTNGVTTLVAVGGYLSGIEDLVYEPASGMLYATSTTWDQIIQIDPTTGAQVAWSRPGDLDNPRSISLYTSSTGTSTLIAMSDGQRHAVMWAASSSVGTAPSGTEDFGGINNLDRPYGIEGAAISSTNTWFTTDAGTGRAWRTDGSTDRNLNQNLRTPRDIVRAPSGNLYIADSGSGQVLQMADCGSPPCDTTTIAVGTWEPWGLWFESATSLLVTDRNGNTMYRITGNF